MKNKKLVVFGSGAAIGALGGLVGLGGAEFRLPLLIGAFGFRALEAVILNKAMSLIVVASALPFRTGTIPLAALAEYWPVVLNLLAGSLAGAWLGAGWASRLKTETLYKIVAALLVAIALLLLFGHSQQTSQPALSSIGLWLTGTACGFVIGGVASLMGVAGGELLIPTLVLLFGLDIKLAGSLSLAISLPTMLAGFARYSRDQSFAVVGINKRFVLMMAAGSLVGTFLGGQLLGVVQARLLSPLLAAILLVSAVKVWRHG